MAENVKKLITHSGSFHADDIFATAVLTMLLERKGEVYQVVRTRDPEIIQSGDYVYDVGGVYDEAANRFDHHQVGGAGQGKYGIDYSSFGLVWKKFGAELCESQKVADIIDKRLVVPIDAGDNGIDLVTNKYEVSQYVIQNFFSSMQPTWREASPVAGLWPRENITQDEQFMKCVETAKGLLVREIAHARDFVIAEDKVLEAYNKAKDKRFITLDEDYPAERTLINFPEPLFVLYPRKDGTWGVKGVPKSLQTFQPRKTLPEAWGGLTNEKLQNITGVPDAIFAHRALFLAVAQSKEGALKLAEVALRL